jgi:hypothetical protein
MEWDPNFNLWVSCQVQLPVDKSAKLEMLSELSKVVNNAAPFHEWMNREDVKDADRKPYVQSLINMQTGYNSIYLIFKAAGITEEEMSQYANIPF